MPKTPDNIPDYNAYLADRRRGLNSIIGLVTFLGITAIIGAVVIVIVLANAGVFNG